MTSQHLLVGPPKPLSSQGERLHVMPFLLDVTSTAVMQPAIIAMMSGLCSCSRFVLATTRLAAMVALYAGATRQLKTFQLIAADLTTVS